MKIEGSIALVTGANRGLGKALVAALLEGGAAKVYATARDEAGIDRRARVVPLRLDVTDPTQIAAGARTASDVTLLVNNAGVMTSHDVLGAGRALLDVDLRTNALGMLDVTTAFVPVLARARGAAVVNVLSLAALASLPELGGYSASKATAYAITLALRPRLRAQDIEVLAALPGPIDTDMVRALALPKTPAPEVARRIVLGIARGDEEIFPDPMAEEMGALWMRSPRELARAFGAM